MKKEELKLCINCSNFGGCGMCNRAKTKSISLLNGEDTLTGPDIECLKDRMDGPNNCGVAGQFFVPKKGKKK